MENHGRCEERLQMVKIDHARRPWLCACDQLAKRGRRNDHLATGACGSGLHAAILDVCSLQWLERLEHVACLHTSPNPAQYRRQQQVALAEADHRPHVSVEHGAREVGPVTPSAFNHDTSCQPQHYRRRAVPVAQGAEAAQFEERRQERDHFIRASPRQRARCSRRGRQL
eukprot:6986902-Prymnesium_polylepis.1